MNGKICSCCGVSKKLEEYYSSSSYFNKYTGKINICKSCLWDYVIPNDSNLYDIEKIKLALRIIDKPFIYDMWSSSILEANKKGNTHPFKMYMKNIAMKDFRDLSWDDSDFGINHDDDISELNVDDLLIDCDSVDYWGSGYSEYEYEFLENERIKLTTSFECPDYGMEMIMKDICFINLDIDRIRKEKKDNSHKTITGLIETRSKLMNDANMKPIQSTGADGNDQVTFGTLIRKWENERPIPKPLDDEMKEYIDTYMIGHLAKMEGLSNEMTKKYDEVLSEYTINYNDVKNKNEEWDD